MPYNHRTPCEIARFVADVPASVRFYTALLGYGPEQQSETMAVFAAGDLKIFIHARYCAGPDDVPCEDHIAMRTDDVDAAAAELSRQGLVLEVPPRDFAWGRSAYLRDPDGRLVELKQG